MFSTDRQHKLQFPLLRSFRLNRSIPPYQDIRSSLAQQQLAPPYYHGPQWELPMANASSLALLTTNMNGNYNQRVPMGAYGMNGMQGPLNNFSNLKSALPSPVTAQHPAAAGRLDQNNPVMVLPSGQTVPISAFLPPAQSTNEQAAYHQNSMYGGYMNNMAQGAMAQYNNGLGYQPGMTEFEPAQRAVWPKNDENAGFNSSNGAMTSDFYPGYPYQSQVDNQTYIAGPIQPMKTKDNKGYEMVNLDELVMRDPPLPRAVPALWTNQEELSLAKCLQNPEGITNIYIRGFMPDTTDEDLHQWASRFGEIESCKAIIEQDTGKCKGFGFVMYYSPASAENCIRGFFHLGFQASYAQKSRNARLKDLEDRTSTNIYCTGVPIDWNEADLAKHFLPYRAISTKICRDTPSGVSKEVGFARFETREVAEQVVRDFHSVLTEHDGVKLFLRFADTKAQKQLKLQSQERRSWRSREYSYSVEHTPSPTLTRFQNAIDGVSPGSYQSPAGAGHSYTPDTSVSPPEAQQAQQAQASKQTVNTTSSRAAWPMQGGLASITNTASTRIQTAVPAQNTTTAKTEPAMPLQEARQAKTPSPKKGPAAPGKENISTTPQSTE
ncbi:hypothetical protein PMZ80_001682 [Knufia obscura]|uniref:RRM domain-containing protein n=1 Tax=Knufia obscura TaxID=1635080 RepID=A0ABR0S3V8_9EURO|nr:hypothetical protein PMZ80_001682 [Knufia obscura]